MATTQLLGQGMTPLNRPHPSLLAVPHPYPLDFYGPKHINAMFEAQGISILVPGHPIVASRPLHLDVVPSVVDAAVDLGILSYNRKARLWVIKPFTNEDGTNPYSILIPNPGDDPLYFWLKSVSLNASVDIYFDPGPDNLWVALPDPYTVTSVAGIAPRNLVPPALTGTPTVGSVVTVNTGVWSGTPPLTYLRQWLRNGVAIPGATAETYTIQAADLGNALMCRVIASNGISSATAISNTRTISAAPVNTVAPVISGTPTVGQQLSATNGTWTGTGLITYAYQWRRNGNNIAGAIGTTYTLANADANAAITCVVTANNEQGNAIAVSNTLNVVAAPPALDFSLPNNSQYVAILAAF